MSKPIPIITRVKHTSRLSENMQSVILESERLKQFPDVQPGAYIKLIFEASGVPFTSSSHQDTPRMMRTYTIRKLDKDKGQLQIDMVLHAQNGVSGPAATWAAKAKPGDEIAIAGPGSVKQIDAKADWVLLAGDTTALPAIESHLERIPKDTTGYAFISVASENDIRTLVKPKDIDVIWVDQNISGLANSISNASFPDSTPSIWAAAEFSQMREMRALFAERFSVSRNELYLSSYWKFGRSDEQHKIDKRNDAMQLQQM